MHARHAVCHSEGMSMLLGAAIGWFFGMLIAATYAASERYRGYVDAERTIRAIEREVERDERLARWQRA